MRPRWPGDFDAIAMYEAMDAERARRGLSWSAVARELAESGNLGIAVGQHPISPSTITGIAKRGDTTCQHALFFLRWLGRTPESFIETPSVSGREFPSVGSGLRFRWNLSMLYEALNVRRKERALSWADTARELRCSESQLTGIRTAKYAIGMRLAMRITQWLGRPAADFVYPANW
jgi:hypothetical protein